MQKIPPAVQMTVFFASQFQYIVIAALLAWMCIDRKREIRGIIFGALASALVSRLIFTEIIRHIWYRPRPFVAYDFVPLIPHDASAAFPSGHAAFFFGLAWFIFFYRPRTSIVFFIAGILISTTRVLAGIHYTTDILGGAMVGLLAAWLVRLCIIRFTKADK